MDWLLQILPMLLAYNLESAANMLRMLVNNNRVLYDKYLRLEPSDNDSWQARCRKGSSRTFAVLDDLLKDP